MKSFIDIRPPAPPTIASCNRVSRALTPSQHQPNIQTDAKKINEITRDAFKNISKKNIILQEPKDAIKNKIAKQQHDQFTRVQRNLAIANLMRTGGIRQITADDLLHYAQNLHDAHNGDPANFVSIKSVPQKKST